MTRQITSTSNGYEGKSVVFDRIEKIYNTADGSLQALSSISFTINAGEFVSIVGPSGCGKSTLMMLMSGLIPITKGNIYIGDQLIQKPYTDLGIVFQKDVLLDWRTVMSNVILPVEIKKLKPRDYYQQRAHDFLNMVELDGFENRFPNELSGGMRQRVSICRALITKPPLLLMDEPFGALDALTREQMNDDLLKLWSRSRNTVLFITHNISEAVYMSDRVVVMSKRPGRILEIIDISDIPRPRNMNVRDLPEFGKHVSQIRQIFVKQGILHTEAEMPTRIIDKYE